MSLVALPSARALLPTAADRAPSTLQAGLIKGQLLCQLDYQGLLYSDYGKYSFTGYLYELKKALKALWLKRGQTPPPLMEEENIFCFPGFIQHQNLRSLENVGFHTLKCRNFFLPNSTQYSTGLLRKHQELNCNIGCFMFLPVIMEDFFIW